MFTSTHFSSRRRGWKAPTLGMVYTGPLRSFHPKGIKESVPTQPTYCLQLNVGRRPGEDGGKGQTAWGRKASGGWGGVPRAQTPAPGPDLPPQAVPLNSPAQTDWRMPRILSASSLPSLVHSKCWVFSSRNISSMREEFTTGPHGYPLPQHACQAESGKDDDHDHPHRHGQAALPLSPFL